MYVRLKATVTKNAPPKADQHKFARVETDNGTIYAIATTYDPLFTLHSLDFEILKSAEENRDEA